MLQTEKPDFMGFIECKIQLNGQNIHDPTLGTVVTAHPCLKMHTANPDFMHSPRPEMQIPGAILCLYRTFSPNPGKDLNGCRKTLLGFYQDA